MCGVVVVFCVGWVGNASSSICSYAKDEDD